MIVLTSPNDFPKEGQIITELFKNGLEILHLRKPYSSPKECEKVLKEIPPKYYRQIKVHQHFDLVKKYDLMGIHLNHKYRETVGFEDYHISKSCHELSELEDVRGFDYVFLSPIFDSISKQNYISPFSHEKLCEARKNRLINQKIIALGGINRERFPLLKQYDFGGVALLGAIWHSSNPLKEFINFKK